MLSIEVMICSRFARGRSYDLIPVGVMTCCWSDSASPQASAATCNDSALFAASAHASRALKAKRQKGRTPLTNMRVKGEEGGERRGEERHLRDAAVERRPFVPKARLPCGAKTRGFASQPARALRKPAIVSGGACLSTAAGRDGR